MQDNCKKQQYAIVSENTFLKFLLQKVFEITTRISLASLTAMIDGASDPAAKNLTQREEFNEMPLSSLPDYF